ncbi:MAG: glycosyltransferase family 2 protein [Candidatus Omnitrophica bacterium]|nr:glycosyltransferase family 2 protein [Candidatus Omnitrophota bacterium]MDD5771204.1 glycosyltransferase family 2 protein [Candidatus Omnitrophota bacterium]
MNDRDIAVSIIIVTSGSGDYLKAALASVKEQDYRNQETIVVDNSLNPQLPLAVNSLLPSARVCSNSRNLYYGASQNIGIMMSRGEFVLCLNDDVVLDRSFISQALKGFLLSDEIGMVSGKILRMDGLTLDSAGLFLTASYSAGERGYGRIDSGKFEKSGFIFGVSGAAAFYRRSMLEDIKSRGEYFDPALRMFYEDLDLAWRANKRGWKGYYIPSARAFHVRGGSWRPPRGLNKPVARKYVSDQLHYELIKNRYLVILKNARLFALLLHLLPVLLYDLCAWGYVLAFRPKVAGMFLSSLKSVFRPGRSKYPQDRPPDQAYLWEEKTKIP